MNREGSLLGKGLGLKKERSLRRCGLGVHKGKGIEEGKGGVCLL